MKKIHASGLDELLESTSCLLLVVEAFSLQNVVEMLKEVVRWIWQMRQNSVAQFIQLLKRWLCNMWLGIVMEKNWTHSIDQLQFLLHLINLLSILLRCNGFARIQKVSGSDRQQTTKQWPWPFSSTRLTLGSVLDLLSPLSWSLSVVIYNSLFIASHILIEKWFIVVA